ncbi:glycosyltransferase family 4 protein [Candidatus Viadribacter manganicus]|uniref:glycosyltransferase family 4 protein n=1 Tax=Candidatus Viadribacter manganicus TaxID=1759059 RepID=UPI0009F4DB66|nr:glycosyltransferase family 4 protein [Candidatus Viadribacter manganicus]
MNLSALLAKIVIKHRFSQTGGKIGQRTALQEGHNLTVLQVTPELNAGGVERTTLEIAEAISRAGGLALVAAAGGRLEPDLKTAGGELIRIPAHSKNPITMIANAFKLAEIARKRKVQIIHARSRAPGWSALFAARMAKVPFVTTYHGIYNAKSPLKAFYNSVMARGDAIIANSEFTREHVLAHHDVMPERVTAIPRGVDLAVFDSGKIAPQSIAALRAEWRVKPDQCVVFVPARLTRWKGQTILIEAARLLNERRPNAVKFIIAGDDQGRRAYSQEMLSAIKAGGLQDVVAMVGHLRQMPLAFAACDMAVFPVIEPEAFGRGAVEAEAMGVPVIASNLGGYTETVVEGQTGFLVPAGAAAPLCGAIERMIDAGAEKRAEMGRNGQERVKALYSKLALQSATLAVYERVLRQAESRKVAKSPGQPVL